MTAAACRARATWRQRLFATAAGAVALLLAPAVTAAAVDDTLALKVKAAVLYNFAKFVVWPAEKFQSADDPLLLCVLLPDPFGPILDDTVRGKTVGGRPLVVRRAPQAAELRDCHLVYSGETDSGRLLASLAALSSHSVLVVHEYGEPLRDGSVRLQISERRVRFEVNVAAVERERLQLSSKLLVLSDVVRR